MKFPLPATVAALSCLATIAWAAPSQALSSLPQQQFRVILGVGATPSEVTLSWRTPLPGPSFVEIQEAGSPTTRRFEGTERNSGALFYRSMHATLTDLKPGTTYQYRIGIPGRGWDDIASFTTSSNTGTWNFLALADPQIGVKLKNAEQGRTWRATIGSATSAHPDADMIISLGDQVDGWGPAQPQYDEFFSAPQLRSYPTAVIPGNHETYLGGMRHFDEHFSLPEDEQRDYAFVKGNVLFIALDSNQNRPEDIARHREFVRTAVAKHPDVAWTVAALHHAPFSHGSHTNDPDVVALREGLAPTFSETGVDVVLSGHDHIYTRSQPMSGTAPMSTGRGQIGDNIAHEDGHTLYVTTTTAGAGKFYDYHDRNSAAHPGATMASMDPALDHPWAAVWHQDYTPDYLAVSVSPEQLRLRTVDAPTGELIDDVSLTKSTFES